MRLPGEKLVSKWRRLRWICTGSVFFRVVLALVILSDAIAFVPSVVDAGLRVEWSLCSFDERGPLEQHQTPLL
jgi:hypothetical protein